MSIAEHRAVILRALERFRGSDLQTLRFAFKGLSEAAMQQPWGKSGKTRQQRLDEAIAHDAEINAAIAWVEEQP